jgi:YidC/Oxa1 family membrane protein insertase
MKLNRKFSYQPAMQDPQMGCSNNMMDITMPLMSVYITFITPAAIGIYWIFKCIIGVLKQFVLHKLMPLPTFTEEDYKRAEKELKGKARSTVYQEAPQNRGPARSLHHIDDDEYDAKGNYIGRSEQAEQEAEAAQSKKDQKAPAMAEPLKDESDKKQNDADSDRTTNS